MFPHITSENEPGKARKSPGDEFRGLAGTKHGNPAIYVSLWGLLRCGYSDKESSEGIQRGGATLPVHEIQLLRVRNGAFKDYFVERWNAQRCDWTVNRGVGVDAT